MATVEGCGERGVAAEQGSAAVVVALGLDDLVAFDGAELADRAVDGATKALVASGLAPGLRARVKKSLKLA